jgi:transcriptional regulator with XRE-family HTH domain
MSQAAFAEFLGLSRPTIGFYERADMENGRIPDIDTLKQICEKCNVSADYLLGISDEKTKADINAYTGLDENVTDYLHTLQMASGFIDSQDIMWTINKMLSASRFDSFIRALVVMITFRSHVKPSDYKDSREIWKAKALLKKSGYVIAPASHEAELMMANSVIPQFKAIIKEIVQQKTNRVYADGSRDDEYLALPYLTGFNYGKYQED